MADQPGSVVVYKRDVKKQRFGIQYRVVIYILSFFFNIVEINLCRENGIPCFERENCGDEFAFHVSFFALTIHSIYFNFDQRPLKPQLNSNLYFKVCLLLVECPVLNYF